MIEYTLIRSKRKSIAIHIKKDATLEVRAPHRTSIAEIEKLILLKEKWIKKRLAEIQIKNEKKAEFHLNYGDYLKYKGRKYSIVSLKGNRIGYQNETFYFPDNLNTDQIKDCAVQICKELAKRDLIKKAVEFSKEMKVSPAGIKINSAKTRWGSCSGKNSINFSWRLIMADDYIIDYVVVHELAHIKQHNHSPAFWAVVKEVFPDYKEREKALKKFQKELAFEDWE